MYLLGKSECLMPLNPGVMVWVGVRVKQCAGYSCYLHELVVYLCQAEKYLIVCETVLVCVLVLVCQEVLMLSDIVIDEDDR